MDDYGIIQYRAMAPFGEGKGVQSDVLLVLFSDTVVFSLVRMFVLGI